MDSRRVSISDIATINGAQYSPEEGWLHIQYLDTGSVTRGAVYEIQQLNPHVDKIPSRARRKVKQNSIVYSMVRPNQEHHALLVNPANDMLVSTGFSVIDANQEYVSPGYLYYALTAKEITEHFQSLAEQRVSTYPTLSVPDLASLELLLPCLEEQKAIEEILGTLDKKVKLNNRLNDYLAELAQALYNDWFRDFGHWGGQMPAHWERGVLGDYVTVKRGGSPRPIQEYLSDEGLRWLKIADVTNVSGPYILEIKEHIKEEGLRKTVHLEPGSLVLSNSATPGIPKILSIDTCIHDGWLYFPQSQFSNEWLYCYFLNIRQELVRMANGSVFQNLKTDIVKNFEVVKPDDATLSLFQEMIIPVFEAMEACQKESRQLADFRDTLLPKLMSGEIDVSKVDLTQLNNHFIGRKHRWRDNAKVEDNDNAIY